MSGSISLNIFVDDHLTKNSTSLAQVKPNYFWDYYTYFAILVLFYMAQVHAILMGI